MPNDQSQPVALRRSLVFATDALEPLVGLAQDAERAGFDRVWSTEYLHRDAVARALSIALGTTTIGVGTGIAYAFTRLPVAMAGLAADVQRLAGGRFSLGLGTGSKGVRRWFGAEFEPPARKFAEYTETLRSTFDAMPAWGSTGPPPVYGAGLMPIMTRTAVRASDGVLLHPLALVRTHLHERVLPAIQRGCDDRGSSTFVAAWCITSIADDEDVARERARRQLAFYLSTPSYGGVVEGTPWERVATDVRDGFVNSGRTATWAELAPLIPDALLDEVALTGTQQSVAVAARRLEEELGNHHVDELVFQTVGAGIGDDDVVANCASIVAALGRPLSSP
jgi:alkanesulfonate monooxygenase SsuD/methylene tetrahydromethanopterin reductase-like flavin-dependent oxidoreductase (luciferase family)